MCRYLQGQEHHQTEYDETPSCIRSIPKTPLHGESVPKEKSFVKTSFSNIQGRAGNGHFPSGFKVFDYESCFDNEVVSRTPSVPVTLFSSAYDMNIRPYQESDEQEVVQLWIDCGLVAPQNNPIQDIERKSTVNPEWFLVGSKGGKVIASCMVGYEGHRGWINYLAVSPSEQRKGYAKAIMEKAEELLRKAKCPKINLQVRSANSKVIAFYESIGFCDDEVTSLGKRLENDQPFQVESNGMT